MTQAKDIYDKLQSDIASSNKAISDNNVAIGAARLERDRLQTDSEALIRALANKITADVNPIFNVRNNRIDQIAAELAIIEGEMKTLNETVETLSDELQKRQEAHRDFVAECHRHVESDPVYRENSKIADDAEQLIEFRIRDAGRLGDRLAEENRQLEYRRLVNAVKNNKYGQPDHEVGHFVQALFGKFAKWFKGTEHYKQALATHDKVEAALKAKQLRIETLKAEQRAAKATISRIISETAQKIDEHRKTVAPAELNLETAQQLHSNKEAVLLEMTSKLNGLKAWTEESAAALLEQFRNLLLTRSDKTGQKLAVDISKKPELKSMLDRFKAKVARIGELDREVAALNAQRGELKSNIARMEDVSYKMRKARLNSSTKDIGTFDIRSTTGDAFDPGLLITTNLLNSINLAVDDCTPVSTSDYGSSNFDTSSSTSSFD